MQRILHIIGSLNKDAGGPSRSVPQTCYALAAAGIEIEILTRPGKDVVELKQMANFKVRFLSIFQLIQFGRSLSKRDVDLIHLQHVWDPYIHVMAYYARKKGIPYIITPRGMLEPWIMNHNPLKKKLGMWLYQKKDLERAVAIHATCDMEKDNIRKLGFTNPIRVIPNGLDLEKIPTPKQKYGSKKLVFLSRIHEKKGLELLLEAWTRIKTKGWTLEIAGEGETGYVNQLKTKVTEMNLKNVSFVGPQYGLAKWSFLKSADLFVLPTYSENFGIVVAEALAVGLPVITTTGTPWEELRTENCGWWIDLSEENLANALSKSINTPIEELKQMGLNGRKLVKEKYDIRAIGKEMLNMYLHILQ